LSDTSWESRGSVNGNEVDEIEDFSDVNDEWLSSLSNKDSSGGGASGEVNVIFVLISIGGVVREGLGSGIIEGFLEEVGGGSRDGSSYGICNSSSDSAGNGISPGSCTCKGY